MGQSFLYFEVHVCLGTFLPRSFRVIIFFALLVLIQQHLFSTREAGCNFSCKTGKELSVKTEILFYVIDQKEALFHLTV